jgi:hypothetical protein
MFSWLCHTVLHAFNCKASLTVSALLCVQVAVEPMLSFITKVTAVKVATSANPAAAKPLREQVRVTPTM